MLLNLFLELFLATGLGDVTYGARRHPLGAICVEGKIDYHLWSLDLYTKGKNAIAKLCRKTAWRPLSSEYISA